MNVGDYVRFGRECHRIDAIDGDRLTTSKAPPPRRLTVPVFGRSAVPFGRRADVLAALPADVDRAALAWVEAGRDVFAGCFLYLFASPVALRIVRENGTGGDHKYEPAAPKLLYAGGAP